MKRSTVLTALVLAGVFVAILVALFLEAAAGPSFRAEDYESLAECVRGIPAEWGPGSFERDGAERACAYVHGRDG